MTVKVKVGDVVDSDCGELTIVAMSKEWCIGFSAEDDEELAVPWSEVWVSVAAAGVANSVSSMEVDDD